MVKQAGHIASSGSDVHDHGTAAAVPACATSLQSSGRLTRRARTPYGRRSEHSG